MLSRLTDVGTEDQIMRLPNGTSWRGWQSWGWDLGMRALSHPTPPHASPWLLHLGTHRIESTELVAGHGDHHREDLPADEGASQQLPHRHQADVPLHVALCQDLLQLLGHVLLAQEPLEGCTRGQAGMFSRDRVICWV